tara:strand:- start:167 stop:439 length:273 start_codon:yes stop_codon:yes gene_type:complete
LIDYTKKKNWDSLTSLNTRIVNDYNSKKTKEKVVLFDGIQVVTNKFVYGLVDGELSKSEVNVVKEVVVKKPKPKVKAKPKAKPKSKRISK